MSINEILDWAFQRHLNPFSWYIRPIFLILFCLMAYKRSWKGIVIVLLLMFSSMVWFPAPATIDPQMQSVLEYEKALVKNPFTLFLAITAMITSMTLIAMAFWKRSFLLGLIILNIALIGKLIGSLALVGKDGWGPLYVIVFGLVLVNGLSIYFYYKKKKTRRENNRKV
jgi:hypothetical protein